MAVWNSYLQSILEVVAFIRMICDDDRYGSALISRGANAKG